jgi:hypothetical protein
MKNHIKGFSQFINEKTDWFEHSSDRRNQYTPGGGFRPSGPQYGEPSEEIEHDEFMQRYGEEMPQSGREHYGKLGKGRVKLWKEKEQAVESTLKGLSSSDLMGARKNIEKALTHGSGSPGFTQNMQRILAEIEAELDERGGNWGGESGY